MENAELEDLDQLVNSAGWQRFRDHVNGQWARGTGQRYLAGIEQAMSVTDDPSANAQLRQIIVACKEIEGVMRWAQDRIAYLKRVDHRVQEPVLSRRGSL